jgi:hypothetical protein
VRERWLRPARKRVRSAEAASCANSAVVGGGIFTVVGIGASVESFANAKVLALECWGAIVALYLNRRLPWTKQESGLSTI